MKSLSLIWPLACVVAWVVGAGCDDNRPITSLPAGGEPGTTAGQGNAGEPVEVAGGSGGAAAMSSGGQGGAAEMETGGTGALPEAGSDQGGSANPGAGGEPMVGGGGGQGGAG